MKQNLRDFPDRRWAILGGAVVDKGSCVRYNIIWFSLIFFFKHSLYAFMLNLAIIIKNSYSGDCHVNSPCKLTM